MSQLFRSYLKRISRLSAVNRLHWPRWLYGDTLRLYSDVAGDTVTHGYALSGSEDTLVLFVGATRREYVAK